MAWPAEIEFNLIKLKVNVKEDVDSGQHGDKLGGGGQGMVHMAQWKGTTVGENISF